MSTNVWKICQEVNAETLYNNVKDLVGKCPLLRAEKEIVAVNSLTSTCSDMIYAYDDIIKDQNDYMIEVEDITTKMETEILEIKEQIESLQKEIKELEQKVKDGTITKEEEKDLVSKQCELEDLKVKANTSSNEKTKNIEDNLSTKQSERYSKEQIATDYGNTTIEKGEPLANTTVKGGLFRKIFGSTGKDKKNAGEKAIKTGNQLLDKVDESLQIDTDIKNRIKK